MTTEQVEDTAMLAKLVHATIEPERMGLAAAAVREELVPEFRTHDGALQGYWGTDPDSGRVLALTLWRDAESLRAASAADGASRVTVSDRVGLRLHTVRTVPVLDLSVGDADPRWIRVAWMDGLAPASADRPAAAGPCGGYWLGEERGEEGCAVSLWDDTADRVVGAGAGRRRRRRSARTTGARIISVHDYRIFCVARTAPDPTLRALEVASV